MTNKRYISQKEIETGVLDIVSHWDGEDQYDPEIEEILI